jgi:hypothetical protein
MKLLKCDNPKKLIIAKIYSELTPEQQQEAEYFLSRYVDLVQRIFKRIDSAKSELDGLNLTENSDASTMPMN